MARAGWRKTVKFNSNTKDREKHPQRQSVPTPGEPPFQGGAQRPSCHGNNKPEILRRERPKTSYECDAQSQSQDLKKQKKQKNMSMI